MDGLDCSNNLITTVNFSNNLELYELDCSNNQITTLDLSNNVELYELYSSNNLIKNLDLSKNENLKYVYLDSNSLTALNVKNGNNRYIYEIETTNNPNLSCIQVDNAAYSTAYWTDVDSSVTFSTDCVTLSEENSLLDDITFYPNPVKSNLQIHANEDLKYTVFDITGKQLSAGGLINGTNHIDLSAFTSGMLFFKFSNDSGSFVEKIIKI